MGLLEGSLPTGPEEVKVCVVPFYISQRKGDVFLHPVVDGGSQHPVAGLSQISGCQGEWKKFPEKAKTLMLFRVKLHI